MTVQDSKPEPEECPPITVALSGGGHRATLFGLGVLLALVDRGLNGHVQRIASVSGGSITNAFVATRCDFSNTNRQEFDNLSADLVCKVVHKGVLTRPIIYGTLAAILLPPPVLLWLASQGRMPWLLAVSIAIAWVCLGLLRGLLVEWLLEMRFFPPRVRVGKSPPFIRLRRQRIGDLKGRSTEHYIFCTDVPAARPVNFRLTKGHLLSVVSLTEMYRAVISHFSLASVVRASAAFPGIPPRRFRLLWEKGHALLEPAEPATRRTTFLADGGIWDNLASELLRAIPSVVASMGLTDRDCLIVADASVPLSPQRAWPYHIPLWSSVRSLIRIVDIQHLNTVEPRLSPMRDRQQTRMRDRWVTPTGPELPRDIPVCLRSDPERLVAIFDLRFHGDRMVSDLPPQHGWDKIHRGVPWDICQLAPGDVYIGTHLRRVHPGTALAIIARGYVNAFLWSYELRPFTKEDEETLKTVEHRLRKMLLGKRPEMSP